MENRCTIKVVPSSLSDCFYDIFSSATNLNSAMKFSVTTVDTIEVSGFISP